MRFPDDLAPLIPGFEPSGIHVVVTDAEGRIVYANKAAERNTGFTLSEMIGHKPGEVWGGRMPAAFYQDMWRTIRDFRQPYVGFVENHRKTGELYWQELHVVPIVDRQQTIRYFVGLEQTAEKPHLRDALIHEAAGQARPAPLLQVRWPLEWLFDSSDLSPEQLDELRQRYEANKGIDTLTGDLMLLSTAHQASLSAPEKLDPFTVAEEVVREVQARFSGRSYAVRREGGACAVLANRGLLRIVLNAVVTNAAAYSAPKTGQVQVTVGHSGDRCEIVCTDNGIGIAAEDRPRIFRQFFRGVAARSVEPRGSGLGLHIAKLIADAFHWTIAIESKKGAGTTCTITIPCFEGGVTQP